MLSHKVIRSEIAIYKTLKVVQHTFSHQNIQKYINIGEISLKLIGFSKQKYVIED